MRKYILASALLVLSAVVTLASNASNKTAGPYQIVTEFFEVPGGVHCRVTVTDQATNEVVFAPALNFDPAVGASATSTRKSDPGAEWKVVASVTDKGYGAATVTFSRDGKVLKTYRGTTTISKEVAPE